MTILQRERRLFVGKTELLGLWPEFDDVGRGDAWLHDTDRGIHIIATALVGVGHCG